MWFFFVKYGSRFISFFFMGKRYNIIEAKTTEPTNYRKVNGGYTTSNQQGKQRQGMERNTHQPSFTAHPYQEIHQRLIFFYNMDFGPGLQTKNKRGLQSMNRASLIIKINLVSLTPNGPEQAEEGCHPLL